jgi:hypothetical protein
MKNGRDISLRGSRRAMLFQFFDDTLEACSKLWRHIMGV